MPVPSRLRLASTGRRSPLTRKAATPASASAAWVAANRVSGMRVCPGVAASRLTRRRPPFDGLPLGAAVLRRAGGGNGQEQALLGRSQLPSEDGVEHQVRVG